MSCDAYPLFGIYVPFGACTYALRWWVNVFLDVMNNGTWPWV